MLMRQMNYFVRVVECNSFTEAAEQCYISQSAISQQIRALETELGIKLIIRENRKFHLTPAGDYFYWHSKELLSEIEKMKAETKRLGSDNELQLTIGYLSGYNGQELHQAIAQFTEKYPEVSINIINGTHERLYELLRNGTVDMVLNDQRRAFSDEYVNDELIECECYVEISAKNPLASNDHLTLDELKRMPCILITSQEQRHTEQDYYENTLGFGGNFIFAENLDEGHLLVLSGRGFLPIESIGSLPAAGSGIRRLALFRGKSQLKRKYCLFWKKENATYYVEEFAQSLHAQL